MYVIAELGYVLKCYVKQKIKRSFENGLVEKRENLMFYQIFLSPQVKRRAIVSRKHCIYNLSHELPSELGLRILRNYEKSGKFQKFIELETSTQPFVLNEKVFNTSQILLKNRY